MVVIPPYVRAAVAASLLATAVPAQLTWHKSTDLPIGRQGHYGFFDQSRGRVAVVGGQIITNWFATDLWELENGDEWVPANANAVAGRAYGAMCKDVGTSAHWILFGGNDASGTLFGDTLRF